MVTSNKPAANGFVAKARHIYNPLGFAKGYNFILWFIFDGALLGFALSRMMFFSYDNIFCGNKKGGSSAAPGECYYYQKGHYKIGMMIHLFTILPAGLLVFFQFIPAIRHKIILFHRINGYLIIGLTLASIAGTLMIAKHAFGGSLATQAWTGFLSIISIVALFLAVYNIKRLQIDQHRAWMLRAWAWMSSIITVRFIMFISASVIANKGGYYASRPCAQIAYTYLGSGQAEAITTYLYPDCKAFYNGSNPDQHVVVTLNFNGLPDQLGAALGESFGMAVWLALAIHAMAVEIYLKLTPRETQRLRQVSYEKQLEAGMKNPGSAGFTAERFGDADPWMSKESGRIAAAEKENLGPDRAVMN